MRSTSADIETSAEDITRRLARYVLVASLGSMTVHAGSTVPFHATINTLVQPIGTCGSTCVVVNISGTGEGTHVGRSDIDGPSQIDFATTRQGGTSTLTAADGSSMVFTFTGNSVPGPGPGDATFHGTWTVAPGTGRFEDVSGDGTYSGSAGGDTGILFLDGTLSNPGKKR